MGEKSIIKERIFPILFMALITMVCISLVSGLYLSTRELVLLNESVFERKAVLYAAGIDYPDDDPQRIEEIYQQRVEEKISDDDTRYFMVDYEDDKKGYVVFVSGSGVWGEIVSLFGFDKNLDIITGVEFVQQNETPGLGARITEKWFKEQFRGKRGPFSLVPEDADAQKDEINAITGATGTSNSILRIANRALDQAVEAVKGGE